MVRDVGLAEDLAQDALVAALERWPETEVRDNPGAWLIASAKHRAIDHLSPPDALGLPDVDSALDYPLPNVPARLP
jgi:DNA-directed RNA polymerase specialized sigma24 family protein